MIRTRSAGCLVTLLLAAMLAGCDRLAPRPDAMAWIRVRDPLVRAKLGDLVRNPDVLADALAKPGVGNGPLLAGRADPAGWLARSIAAKVGEQSEVATVSIPGEGGVDAAKVVNAVVEACIARAGDGAREEAQARHDALEAEYGEAQRELARAIARASEITRTVADTGEKVGKLRSRRERFERDLEVAETDLAVAAKLGEPADPRLAAKREVLAEEVARIDRELIELARPRAEADEATNRSAALVKEIDRLRRISEDLSARLEIARVELLAPPAIQLLEEAVPR